MTVICSLVALAVANFAICPEPAPGIMEVEYAFLTVYDTALCEPGEMCLQGNGDGRFADMSPVTPAAYLTVAACPMEIHGRMVAVPPLGLELECRDTFGHFNGEPVDTIIQVNGEWAIRLDVYYPVHSDGYPAWNAARVRWEIK